VKPPPTLTDRLCLSCAICCNGVLFRDVELQNDDDPARLQAAGLRLQKRRGKLVFSQPCPALDGWRCRCYGSRPSHCRNFECALFKAVGRNDLEIAKALQLIRTARQRAERVGRLFRQLGDENEQLPFSARFRRLTRRFHVRAVNEETANLFSEMTLAVHDLNLLLRDAFYPGP
jgi:Fe-S-cluster containining protein